MNISRISRWLVPLFLCVSSSTAFSRTLVIDNQDAKASDTNLGTKESPLKTIQAGADQAMAGDKVLVKAGIYREWVAPPRGGSSKEKPIRYIAAPGEEVSVRGSEQIATWKKQDGNVWTVKLDNSFFGTFNPYKEQISGAWLYYGKDNHLGDVYLNGDVYTEKQSLKEVQTEKGSWHSTVDTTTTRIWANFGALNPNEELAEIHVRECIIFPKLKGVKHIIIDGFDVQHAASNWAPPDCFQKGAIGTYFGYGWIIENCTVTDVKNVGICIGATEEHHWDNRELPDINTFGHHIIRNNTIRKCGQAGIVGTYGCVRNVIEGNLIEDIAYRKQHGGAEIGGIKLHFPIDTIIRNNHIRRVRTTRGGPGGIWLDWGAQNTRVTGNLVYDCDAHPLKLEVNHGPVLVDNNIFVGSEIRCWSDGSIFVHNLFYQTSIVHRKSGREVPWYQPHSTVEAGRGNIQLRDDQWFNNLFVGGSGLLEAAPKDGAPRQNRSGYVIDHNVYLDGSGKHHSLDKASITGTTPCGSQFKPESKKVTLKFNLGDAIFKATRPRISSALIGKLSVSKMSIETPDGKPLDIATDYYGQAIQQKRVLPGPFQGMKTGSNTFKLWPKNK